jgi:hyaluronan synthase
LQKDTIEVITKYTEMGKRGWLLRYFILFAVGFLLILKLYWLLFIDFTVGIYGILTTGVLFSYLFCAYIKYRDPFLDAQNITLKRKNEKLPLVSILIAVKNEEHNIENCVQSCINSTYANKEVIVVDDGSSDRTPEILDKMKSNLNIQVIHLPRNVGKKRAIEVGARVSTGEIFIFTDSDCIIKSDAIEKAVKILESDRTIGAIAGHIRERDVESGNFLRKMLDVRLDNSCRIIKGMESYFSSITCCSGPLSAYRREAIMPFMNEWVNDRFMGKEFRFCTDRRLTSFVLNPKSLGSKEKKFPWKLKYSQSMVVYCREPETFRALLKQRVRWQKSFIRSIFATGKIYWKRPFFAALIYYLQLGLRIIRPFIIFKSVIYLPFIGDYITPLLYITGVLFTGFVYAADFRLRNPNTGFQFLYRPLMQIFTIYILTWTFFYALITIRRMNWR